MSFLNKPIDIQEAVAEISRLRQLADAVSPLYTTYLDAGALSDDDTVAVPVKLIRQIAIALEVVEGMRPQ